MTERNHPSIAPFTPTEPLTLRPFPNGGWSVEQPGEPGNRPAALGAYSSAADMITALRGALLGPEADRHG